VQVLPETTAPNGPPSLEAKAIASNRDGLLPLQGKDITNGQNSVISGVSEECEAG